MMNDYAGQFLTEYEGRRYTMLERAAKVYDLVRSIIVPTGAVEFPDISFYQGVVNFDTLKTKTKAVILRLGQNTFIDTQFIRSYGEAGRVGLKRGGYWFFDGRASPQTQADLIIGLLKDRPLEMEMVIDWEHNFGGAHEGLANVAALMQLLDTAGLNVEAIGLYTGYYWFTENSNATTNAGQYNYLKSKPLWLAWYAAASVVKIPAPWTDWTHWQFDTPSVGLEYGAATVQIDMNKANCDAAGFSAKYGGSVPPPADVTHTVPFPGVDYYTFVKNGVRVHVDLIDMAGKRALVTDTNGGLQSVSQAAIQHGAQIAVNGDSWDESHPPPFYPNSLAASDGVVYNNVRNGSPFLNITQSNQLSVPWNDYSNLYNTTSGFRYLVENGVKKSYLDGPEIQYKELHARSAKGITKDGRLMLIVADGTTLTSGLTLSQLADVFIQYGAQVAMDSDSGGSSTLWHKDKIINNPSDGQERAVIQHLLIFIPTIIGGAMKYKVVWSNGVSKRTEPTTSAPTTGTPLPVNTVVDVLQDNIPDKTYPTDPYKKWVKFTDNSYGASLYGQGSVRMELVPEPPPPPPPDATVVSVTLTAVVDGVNYVPDVISGTTVKMKKA